MLIGKDIVFSALAEGIETQKDLLQIKELGVQYGQGWYYRKTTNYVIYLIRHFFNQLSNIFIP